MIYDVVIDGKNYRLELERKAAEWICRLDGELIRIDAVLARRDVVSMIVNGRAYEIKREQSATDMHLWVGSERYAAEISDPRSFRGRKSRAGADAGPKKLIAPMPGRIVRILVAEKSQVELGQGLLVVEAMKMQNEIKSPKKGIVAKLAVAPGATVNAGDVLAIVE